MLPEKMPIPEGLRYSLGLGMNQQRFMGHMGNLLQNRRVIDRFSGRPAPGKGSVLRDQDAGHIHWIAAAGLQSLDHDIARLLFIGTVDLSRRHLPGTGNFPIKGISMGCAKARHGPAGLGPDRGPG